MPTPISPATSLQHKEHWHIRICILHPSEVRNKPEFLGHAPKTITEHQQFPWSLEQVITERRIPGNWIGFCQLKLSQSSGNIVNNSSSFGAWYLERLLPQLFSNRQESDCQLYQHQVWNRRVQDIRKQHLRVVVTKREVLYGRIQVTLQSQGQDSQAKASGQW